MIFLLNLKNVSNWNMASLTKCDVNYEGEMFYNVARTPYVCITGLFSCCLDFYVVYMLDVKLWDFSPHISLAKALRGVLSKFFICHHTRDFRGYNEYFVACWKNENAREFISLLTYDETDPYLRWSFDNERVVDECREYVNRQN